MDAKYTREDSIKRNIELLNDIKNATNEDCMELFNTSRKICLKNVIKRLAEDIDKL